MEWLNYHHLLYFWVVAREGSITRATKRLGLAQPTISAQIRELENALDEQLFDRVGRNLVLTETGQVVQEYADQIFTLGQELLQTLKGHGAGRSTHVAIGIADVVPKLVAHHLVEAVLRYDDSVRVSCHEGRPEALLGQLAQHRLDVVISDAPIPPQVRVQAYNHVLGESEVSVFAKSTLARKLRRGFPQSLDGAPTLLPTNNAVLRRDLEAWFESQSITPVIRGEFDDSALTKVVGQSGAGVFFVPSIIEGEVKKQYGVERVGKIPEVRERFYAISAERRFKNPAVVALTERAKSKLFRQSR